MVGTSHFLPREWHWRKRCTAHPRQGECGERIGGLLWRREENSVVRGGGKVVCGDGRVYGNWRRINES
ncbi:hypothetical protein Tco_1040875 [Tanacetum coccineum]|uniref:Uncharacterized protein n=1 Tax=Tanacetum coccineum TaxID=301880 RepID=A0ABQ5GEL1_9ASTR